MENTLQDFGEDEVVARVLGQLRQSSSRVLVGAGDDCAVLDCGGEELQLLKTDAVVEGVHYPINTDAKRVGWKALARVMSDFAAMGGRPGEFMVTLALRALTPMGWAEELYAGMSRCMEEFGGAIVGGETVEIPGASSTLINISAMGTVARGDYVLRSGGEIGDSLWVTGKLGGSFESERHLDFQPRLREGQWLAQNQVAKAMMDLSDGLASDLPRLARASGCGFQIKNEALPCHEGASVEDALNEGEDFELLFAARGDDWVAGFMEQFPELEVTCIGELSSKEESSSEFQEGWQHFRA